MRPKKVWDSPQAALREGVPPNELVRLTEANTVRVRSGPFKGRVYQRLDDGTLRRVRELEGRS